MASQSTFLEKVLGRIGRLDAQGLQSILQRLARERSFLETLFNIIEDGVLVVDEHGRILYCNQAIIHMLGLQRDAAEGQPISRYLPELDWARFAALDAAGGQRVVRQEFQINFPRLRHVRLYAAPLDGEAQGSSGMALIFHDATEARQKAFEAIESERVQALTLLAGSVAHELGNPLNALHIHLQLMERELRKLRQSFEKPSELALGLRRLGRRRRLIPEPQEPAPAESARKLDSYLQVAKGEITRLDYIVTQFLQALRPSPPQLKNASLNQVARETLELLRPEIENRGQTIEEKLAKTLPEAEIDPAQIKQALVNLIKNAMQAMSRGGRLTVQTGAGADEVWVGVSDTGPGIAPDQLNRIFEPFFTTKKKGSGLGLMTVQRIVRAHGGRVEVDNRPGSGITFRLWLPKRERQPRLLEGPLA